MSKALDARLKSQDLIDPEMVEAAIHFWFTDNQHLRSPFPAAIQAQLKDDATEKFLDWGAKVPEKAKKELNDEILAEKFEEILFEQAILLVKTEDEKLSILYPFLPRLGDRIRVKDIPDTEAESLVIAREYVKRDDHAFLRVQLRNEATGKEWETEFELPE